MLIRQINAVPQAQWLEKEIDMEELIKFGSKAYFMAVYDMNETSAKEAEVTVKEVLQFATSHPEMCLGNDWVLWGSNIMSNVADAGNLPYRAVKDLYNMSRRWAEVQIIVTGLK